MEATKTPDVEQKSEFWWQAQRRNNEQVGKQSNSARRVQRSRPRTRRGDIPGARRGRKTDTIKD